MPPGGLPDAFLDGGEDPLGFVLVRFARGRGPFTTAEAAERFGLDGRAGGGGARHARAREPARPRRAPPGRHRARVVRSGRAAPAAPRDARPAAQGGRAVRAGGARALPSRLAGRRPAREPPRGARPAAGRLRCRCRSGRPTCCRGACPATGRSSSTSCAPPARWSGSAPGSSGSRLLPGGRGRCSAGPAALPAARGTRPPSRLRAALCGGRALLARPPRRVRARSRGRAARSLGARLGRRGHERRLAALAGGTPLRDAEAGDPAPPGRAVLPLSARADAYARRRAAGRSTREPLRRRARPAGAGRAPARAAGHRDARRRARRGRAGRLRAGLPGAAQARDGRRLPPRLLRRRARRRAVRASREPSSGCASGPRRRRRSCSPPPIRPSPTAPRCRGRSGRAVAPRASSGPTSSCSAGEPALFVERGGRSLVSLRDPEEVWLRPALDALVEHARASGLKRLAVERFDGEPVIETDVLSLLVEAGFTRARGGRCSARAETMRADAWDEKWRGRPARHAETSGLPNRFLVSEVDGIEPGRALDLACGAGRNAIWLAEQGWRVTGVDFSTVALAEARRLAAERRVAVEWVQADLVSDALPDGPFDLVVVLYLQLPAVERRLVLERAAQAVAPGRSAPRRRAPHGQSRAGLRRPELAARALDGVGDRCRAHGARRRAGRARTAPGGDGGWAAQRRRRSRSRAGPGLISCVRRSPLAQPRRRASARTARAL